MNQSLNSTGAGQRHRTPGPVQGGLRVTVTVTVVQTIIPILKKSIISE